MPKTVCYFQDSWLKMTNTINGLEKDSDTAFCQYCSRDIKFGNRRVGSKVSYPQETSQEKDSSFV